MVRFIKSLILVLLSTYTFTLSAQKHSYSEKEISILIQSLIGGEREVSVTNGRIDLLLDETAFEIEWASNWKESIGQAIWYGLQSNKQPGIILIIEDKNDYKHFIQLNTALEYAGLTDRFKVHIFPDDFIELIEKQKGSQKD